MQGIYSLLRHYGCGNAINNENLNYLKKLPQLFEQRLKDCYIQTAFNKMRNNKSKHVVTLKENVYEK